MTCEAETEPPNPTHCKSTPADPNFARSQDTVLFRRDAITSKVERRGKKLDNITTAPAKTRASH